MRLYLVRHGDALPEKIDPGRRLSERGRSDVHSVADFLARSGVTVSRVIHSGKMRAEQTAQILGDAVAPSADLETTADIYPLEEIDAFRGRISELGGDTLVVGHLPYMAKLVTSLVCGREDPPAVSYRPGSMVCLEGAGGGGWAIAWMIRPELLRGA